MSHPVKHLAVVAGAFAMLLYPADRRAAAAGQADFAAQVGEYVRAQEALAADDFEGAQSALAALIAIADGVVGPLAETAAGAGDIESLRSAFKPLSELLAGMDLPAGYARAYCPMYDGGSNWVQIDGPVRNPYYGSMMLTCGVVDAAPGAHMDHSPRHGGRVFMAPDSFHHIEGTYPEPGIFRLYATDNYREPVDVTMWMGRVVLEEDYDPATDEFIEVESAALLPAPDGAYLEAEVGDRPLPADFIAKIRMVEDYPEDRFDFIFAELTADAPIRTVTAPTDHPGHAAARRADSPADSGAHPRYRQRHQRAQRRDRTPRGGGALHGDLHSRPAVEGAGAGARSARRGAADRRPEPGAHRGAQPRPGRVAARLVRRPREQAAGERGARRVRRGRARHQRRLRRFRRPVSRRATGQERER